MKIERLLLLLTIFIYSCTGETKIDLTGKHLTEIPPAIFNNNNLVELDLGSGKPIFLPPLADFADPNANYITILPDKFDQLSKLKILILNSNKFSTLPNSIAKLENLETLDVALNPNLEVLNEIEKLKPLKKLKTLKIAGTKLLNRTKIATIQSSLGPNVKVIASLHEYLGL